MKQGIPCVVHHTVERARYCNFLLSAAALAADCSAWYDTSSRTTYEHSLQKNPEGSANLYSLVRHPVGTSHNKLKHQFQLQAQHRVKQQLQCRHWLVTRAALVTNQSTAGARLNPSIRPTMTPSPAWWHHAPLLLWLLLP